MTRLREHDEHQTRQIAPAPPGWRAVYALVPDKDDGDPYLLLDVVAFGEVWCRTSVHDQSGGRVSVTRDWHRYGWDALVMDCEIGTLERPTEAGNFIGVIGPGVSPDSVPWIVENGAAYVARRHKEGGGPC